MELPELISVVTRLAEMLQLPADRDEALRVITRSAVDAIPGVDHASISITAGDQRIRTLAPTDPVAILADELQYELRQGPCYEAAAESTVVQADDLASDPRWPRYGLKAASAFGLGSQVAFQFDAEPHARGALNLYSGRPYAIGSEARQFGMMFAQLTALALGSTRQSETLAEALATRNTIGQAIGVLMERHRLDPHRASALMVEIAQSNNLTLPDVAAAVIADAIDQAN